MKNSKNDFYWKLLQAQLQEKRIEDIFKVFRKYKIEPILIKGWAAARNYPNPFDRLSVDIDIAVNADEYVLGQKILKENQNLGVDLHKGMRHLDTVDWAQLFAETELVVINETQVRILCAEDHLRVMCVHWLTDGGAFQEKLLDIYYAIKNRPVEFDWNKCLGGISKKRRKWITCAIGLAVKYMDLDMSDTSIAEEVKQIPAWIIKTVELEWRTETKLKPLENCLYNNKEFWDQVKLRFAANPIQATIFMDGEFDEKSRFIYQIRSNLKRTVPSLKRIIQRSLIDWRKR